MNVPAVLRDLGFAGTGLSRELRDGREGDPSASGHVRRFCGRGPGRLQRGILQSFYFVYWGNIGIMENMETTIMGYLGVI